MYRIVSIAGVMVVLLVAGCVNSPQPVRLSLSPEVVAAPPMPPKVVAETYEAFSAGFFYVESSLVVAPPPIVAKSFAADYSSYGGPLTLKAFAQYTTNLSNWIKMGEVNYPSNGATLTATLSNFQKVNVRFGYTIKP